MNLAGWQGKLATYGISTALLGVAAFIVVALVGECNSFRERAKEAAQVVVAPPTKLEAKSPEKILPKVDVVAIDPSEKDRKRLAEKYHRPDLVTPVLSGKQAGIADETLKIQQPVTEILGERTLPRLPSGGTALLTMEPGGRVQVTVAPNPEKFFEWQSVYEMGALYGVGQAGDTRGRAWGAVEPLRFGRIHLRVEAGVDLRAGQTDGYAMAGAVWRSR